VKNFASISASRWPEDGAQDEGCFEALAALARRRGRQQSLFIVTDARTADAFDCEDPACATSHDAHQGVEQFGSVCNLKSCKRGLQRRDHVYPLLHGHHPGAHPP
jgi:hypothetical protein